MAATVLSPGRRIVFAFRRHSILITSISVFGTLFGDSESPIWCWRTDNEWLMSGRTWIEEDDCQFGLMYQDRAVSVPEMWTELRKNIPVEFQESLSKCSAAHPKYALWRNISASQSRNLARMFFHYSVQSFPGVGTPWITLKWDDFHQAYYPFPYDYCRSGGPVYFGSGKCGTHPKPRKYKNSKRHPKVHQLL